MDEAFILATDSTRPPVLTYTPDHENRLTVYAGIGARGCNPFSLGAIEVKNIY